MAKLSLNPAHIFRYSKAVAATVNSLYNSIRDWTVSSLSVDSMLPRTVERRHYNEPITIVASKTNRHTGATAVGTPVLEIDYTYSDGNFHALALGFVWPRRGDGDVTNPDTLAPDEGVFIDWYDLATATWHGAYRPLPLPPFWGFGSLDTLLLFKTGPDTSPIPGYPPPELKTGGGPCTVTSAVISRDAYPVLSGANFTKIGLWGTAGHAAFDGQAELWVFAEDKGVT